MASLRHPIRDADDDEDMDDPDYMPSESDDAESSTDTSMLTADTISVIGSSHYPRSSHSASVVSDIYPHDSISHVNYGGRRDWAPSDGDASDPSDPELISFHSDNNDHLYKAIYGRSFSSQSDIYMLPSDGTEHARLDVQHYTLRCHLNSLYGFGHVVQYALREDQDPPPEIFDIGTGSGRWAVEMAAEFPHALVTGMDLTPPTKLSESNIPPNCRFELDDANLSMSHYAGLFNVVHVRSADAGINSFERFLYEVAQTLRPGGVLLLVTGFAQVWDESHQPFPHLTPGDPNFCATQHILGGARTAYHNRGNFAIDSSLRWDKWLHDNPNYRDIVTHDTFIPLGPWQPDMSDREVLTANLMREDIAHIVHALKPLLLADGRREGEIDEWIAQAVRELRDMSIHGMMKWRYTVAIRTEEPWQEHMELPPDLTHALPP